MTNGTVEKTIRLNKIPLPFFSSSSMIHPMAEDKRIARIIGIRRLQNGFRLRDACVAGDADEVAKLIASGADNWRIGLTFAVVGRNLDIIAMMLTNGAPNAATAFKLPADFDLLFDLLTSTAVRRRMVFDVPGIKTVYARVDGINSAVRMSFDERSYPAVLQRIILDYCGND